MSILSLVVIVISLLLTLQSAYSIALMLYAWEDDYKSAQNHPPQTFETPQLSFTILLPARHEEDVIQDTIQRVVDLNYPPELVQILVVIEAGDHGTIAKVEEKLGELTKLGIENVKLLTFDDPPINKPHGLNVGLKHATGDVVTIFDAEDEPHIDILHLVNTVMVRQKSPVVQCGVQLMNYADKWFSALNVLEYFFWFRSRLHYHSTVGMVPLGGNTIFMQRDLLEKMGGWDQTCLTEDADIGIRLSTERIPIRIIYSDTYVTKEETPPSASQFIKQRTRWNQGFLQVLGKGEWRQLPNRAQRLLALYTLSFPLVQAFTAVYIVISLIMALLVRLPVVVVMVSSLPLFMLCIQLVVSLAGLYEFSAAHRLKVGFLTPVRLVLSFIPFQLMLNFSALRAVWRQLRRINTWEKTKHVGAHRKPGLTSEPALVAVESAPVALVEPVTIAAEIAPATLAPLTGQSTEEVVGLV